MKSKGMSNRKSSAYTRHWTCMSAASYRSRSHAHNMVNPWARGAASEEAGVTYDTALKAATEQTQAEKLNIGSRTGQVVWWSVLAPPLTARPRCVVATETSSKSTQRGASR